MGHADAGLVAWRHVEVEPESLALMDRDLALLEPAKAKLRALQVGEHPQRPLYLELGGADGLEAPGMVVVGAVAEIQAEHVRAGACESLHLFG